MEQLLLPPQFSQLLLEVVVVVAVGLLFLPQAAKSLPPLQLVVAVVELLPLVLLAPKKPTPANQATI